MGLRVPPCRGSVGGCSQQAEAAVGWGGGNWWRPRHPLGSPPSEEQGIPFAGRLRCTVTGDFGKH